VDKLELSALARGVDSFREWMRGVQIDMINYYKIGSINQHSRRSAVPMLKFIIVEDGDWVVESGPEKGG
jgi:phospholipid N-methyltransferase